MGNTEKFLMLFSDFDMIVVEKANNRKDNNPKITTDAFIGQTKSELKKVLKRLTEEYNKAKRSFKENKLSRQELFDFEWRMFEIQEEIKKLDDETAA